MTNPPPLYFKRNAVEPTVCIKAGWSLIKDQYWLFLGMSLLTILIGGLVPFGILLGPMMCGVFLALFKRMRGETVDSGLFFKGFDYFGNSVVATLLHIIPVVIIVVPFYISFYVGMFLMLRNTQNPSEMDPTTFITFIGFMVACVLVMTVLIIIISVVFTFAYPLIVDRKLSGLDAVKLSAKAAVANFWRLLGLLLLTSLLSMVGVLLCYVGVFLVLPVNFAALAVAYEQVFGLEQTQSQSQSPFPPPPPSFR